MINKKKMKHVEVNEDLHTKIKLCAVKEKKNMKDIVFEILRKEFEVESNE